MPAGDGTGPTEMGPMTGRAAGYCAGFDVPGFMNPMSGRGMGRGFGRGRGWRHGRRGMARSGGAEADRRPTYAASSEPTVQETESLKAQAARMERALDEIRKRLAELETAPSPEN